MTKHTPGPWIVQQSDDPKAGLLIKPVPGDVVAECDPLPEMAANARLIAAAPELLEALQNLENDDGRIPDHAWAMVQAAIAKATGGAE